MNIAFLNASISRMAGGVFEVERRLAQKLQEIPGVKVQVFGLKDDYIAQDLELWRPLKPQVHKAVASNNFGYSTTLLPAIKKSKPDLLHLQVLWMYPSVASLRTKLPYITTIHGMLDAWAVKNSRLKKLIASRLYEKAALKKASCLHAITAQEYHDIRNFGLTNPVAIIPNGVDLPKDLNDLKKQPPVWINKIDSNKKVLLYLGRIHPKKGLENLIKAWKEASEQQKDRLQWVLAIAGWGQPNHEEEVKQLINAQGLADQVLFLGPQFNKQKELCFAHASAFVLPSFSEGLPMAVLEAWAFNLPVLMTKECNLPEGFEKGAALQIETTIEGIRQGLDKLFAFTDEQLAQIGDSGRSLVVEKFDWNVVRNQMYEVYEWILGKRKSAPETVILN